MGAMLRMGAERQTFKSHLGFMRQTVVPFLIYSACHPGHEKGCSSEGCHIHGDPVGTSHCSWAAWKGGGRQQST